MWRVSGNRDGRGTLITRGRLTWRHSSRLSGSGCWSILGGAFGLKLGGVEDAILAVGADGKCLCVAFECVGRRLGTLIVDHDRMGIRSRFGVVALKLSQNKGDMRSALLNAFRLDESFDTEMALICLVSHALHLSHSNEIALVRCRAGVREVADRAQNDDGCDRDSDLLFGKLQCHFCCHPVLPGVPLAEGIQGATLYCTSR